MINHAPPPVAPLDDDAMRAAARSGNPWTAAWETSTAHEAAFLADLDAHGGERYCTAPCDPHGRLVAPVTDAALVPALSRRDAPRGAGPAGVLYVCTHAKRDVCPRGLELRRARDGATASDLREHIAATGVPLRLAGIDLDRDGSLTAAVQAARSFVAAGLLRGGALVLTGAPGVGKSWAAAGIVTAAVRLGMRPLWLDAAAVARIATSDSRWAAVLDAALLVADDLGTEYEDRRGWTAGRLGEVVSARHANARATVFTTNLDAAALEGRYNVRLVSRLVEWAGPLVDCGSTDLRRGSP